MQALSYAKAIVKDRVKRLSQEDCVCALETSNKKKDKPNPKAEGEKKKTKKEGKPKAEGSRK